MMLAATEPTKDVNVTLHFLKLLPMTFRCHPIPLTVALMLLPVLRFLVKFVSQLVSGKIISGWWRRWENISELLWHDDWG
jgi:hypothetical protein